LIQPPGSSSGDVDPRSPGEITKPDGGTIPYVGGLFYLLLIGEIPSKAQAEEVEAEWARRSDVPRMYTICFVQCQRKRIQWCFSRRQYWHYKSGSKFAKAYHDGIKKDLYWESPLRTHLT
jgi:citrate synthase